MHFILPFYLSQVYSNAGSEWKKALSKLMFACQVYMGKCFTIVLQPLAILVPSEHILKVSFHFCFFRVKSMYMALTMIIPWPHTGNVISPSVYTLTKVFELQSCIEFTRERQHCTCPSTLGNTTLIRSFHFYLCIVLGK